MPRHASHASGSALTAIISRRSTRMGDRMREAKAGARDLPRADCQKDFSAERVLELFEFELRLTLVAQHF